MPAALSIQIRQEIIEKRESGESFKSIARELTLSYAVVRNIYHRFVKTGKVALSYDKCSHTAIRKEAAIYEQAILLKQAHPKWGAGLIWVELADKFPTSVGRIEQ